MEHFSWMRSLSWSLSSVALEEIIYMQCVMNTILCWHT